MLYLYIILGYVYLFIHRPFEIWPAVGDMRVELIYFMLLSAGWLILGPKRVRLDSLMLAIVGMTLAVGVAWVLSPWGDRGETPVRNYLLVVGFALILGTSLRNERDLYVVVAAFMAVMALYMAHSVREFIGGRYVYRMSIVRLVGVDTSLGDPNSFGATIVYALPFVRFLWFLGPPGWAKRIVLGGYLLLSFGCVALTGSRSSMVGVGLWGFLTLMLMRRKAGWLVLLAGLSVGGWFVLPESLQNRFETIVNPDVGPANAKESGEGRITGFYDGLDLWERFPISGVGPGAWRIATGRKIEAHNLYGQLLGELGTVGALAFLFMLAALFVNYRKLGRLIRAHSTDPKADPLHHLMQAMALSTLLLLFEGMFGHNLYRYNWVWYCAFTSVALAAVRQRATAPDTDVISPARTDGWAYLT
jgi:O-antigen ligase